MSLHPCCYVMTMISDHEHLLTETDQVQQVHIIIDELARALQDIDDTTQTNTNVRYSFVISIA